MEAHYSPFSSSQFSFTLLFGYITSRMYYNIFDFFGNWHFVQKQNVSFVAFAQEYKQYKKKPKKQHPVCDFCKLGNRSLLYFPFGRNDICGLE